MDELSSMDVQEILIAEGCLKRRKEAHTYKHRAKRRKLAEHLVTKWLADGVSKTKWEALSRIPSIQSKVKVIEISNDVVSPEPIMSTSTIMPLLNLCVSTRDHQSIHTDSHTTTAISNEIVKISYV